MKVLFLEGIHPIAKKLFESAGFSVETRNFSPSAKSLSKELKGFNILGIRSRTGLKSEILKENPQLHVIGAFCRGTNQVDTVLANQMGIPIFHSPYANTRSVAELVISIIVALSRRLFDQSLDMHKGLWDKSSRGSHEIRGKTLGIVGYGHIGSQVSVLAEAMGMNVYFYDILPKLPLGNSKPLESLKSLLRVSDFVTLHVPSTTVTKNMIGSKEIKIMKKGSYLMNMSRGSVVDLKASERALRESHLAGAHFDVFPEEPSENRGKFSSPLKGLKNVILTPHIGGSTEEAQENIGKEVAQKIIEYVSLGSSLEAMNFPVLKPPPLKTPCRILNIHKNIQGVLKEIGQMISDAGYNIEAQHLATDSNIGYLIMDIDQMASKKVLDKIKNLPTSLKTRTLP